MLGIESTLPDPAPNAPRSERRRAPHPPFNGTTEASAAGLAAHNAALRGKRVGPLAIWCREHRVALFKVAAAAECSMKTAKRLARLEDLGRVTLKDLVNVAYAIGCLPVDLVPGLGLRSDGRVVGQTPKAKRSGKRELAALARAVKSGANLFAEAAAEDRPVKKRAKSADRRE